jgi:hypothetical protein
MVPLLFPGEIFDELDQFVEGPHAAFGEFAGFEIFILDLCDQLGLCFFFHFFLPFGHFLGHQGAERDIRLQVDGQLM